MPPAILDAENYFKEGLGSREFKKSFPTNQYDYWHQIETAEELTSGDFVLGVTYHVYTELTARKK